MNRIIDLKRYDKPKCVSGVYILFYKDEIVYIGQSYSIYERITRHACGQLKANEKLKIWDSFAYIEVNGRINRLTMETELLQLYKPKYNTIYKTINKR